MARPADPPPSLRLVAAGGVGVLVVVAFVAAVALGGRSPAPAPGDRIGLARAGGPAGLAVLVPRCGDERVVGVEVRVPDGPPLWRVVSPKGGIEDRYVVGTADPPFGFTTDVPLEGQLPPGPLTVTATWERPGPGDGSDRVSVDPAVVPEDGVHHRGQRVGTSSFERRALAVAGCGDGRGELDVATLLFAAGAAAVVVTYGMLVARYLRGRGSPPG